MNNIPIHSPLYAPDQVYGSDDCESIRVLLEVEEDRVRKFLEPTPFKYVSPHTWLEVVVLHSAFGVAPFVSGGVIVPARFRETVGGFYAYCYIDTDDGMALGREPWGYPKKYADGRFQRTGRAATGAFYGKKVHLEMSVVLDQAVAPAPPVSRYPELLLQVFPSADASEVLLKRVNARDTSVVSKMTVINGEGAVTAKEGPEGNELEWLSGAKVVHGSYAYGSFRGVPGKALAVVEIGRELREGLRELL